jgi:hypothetical protein
VQKLFTGSDLLESDLSSTTNLLDELREFALQLEGIQSLESIPDAEPTQIENKLLEKIKQKELLELGEVAERLFYLVKQDFQHNRTVLVEGWILSETEFELLTYKKTRHIETGIDYVLSEDKSSFTSAKYGEFINVKAWGPKETCVGTPFNQQADGHSSNWFSVSGYSGPMDIYFSGKKIKTTFKGPVATTRIDGELFKELTALQGEHEVVMYNPIDNIKQKIGKFVVVSREGTVLTKSGDRSKYFGEIVSWGPKSTKRLTPFNIQKDGSSALWIKTECPPADVVVILGGVKLSTTVKRNIIAARVENLGILKNTGSVEIVLSSKSANEEILVGRFDIK